LNLEDNGTKPLAGGVDNNFQSGGWKAHRVLIVCSLLYILNYMDRVTLTIVLQPIKMELSLTDFQLGSIQMAFLLSHSLSVLPISFIVDRWSRTRAIGILALIWSFFTAFTGVSWNYGALIASRIFVGIGATGLVAGGVSLTSAAYPKEKQGWAMGIFSTGIPLGLALGAVSGGILAAVFGWRLPFLLLAGLGLVLAVAAFFLKDYTSINEGIAGNLHGFFQSVGSLLNIRTLRWFLPGYGLLMITSQAQILWLPTFLIRQFQMGTDKAGYIMCALSLLAVAGAIIGGRLSDSWYRRDRRGRLWLPAVASIISSVLLALSFLCFNLDFWMGMAVSVVFGFVNMTAIPALTIVSQDVAPQAHKGLSYGLTVLCMYLLGGAWSPVIVGALSDNLGGGAAGLMWAVVISSAGGLLACLCFFMGAKHYREDEKRAMRNAAIQGRAA
jgi:MFS family permease